MSDAAGLITCPGCEILLRLPAAPSDPRCTRCGARVRRRKPDSFARTWALVLAATILYVPANYFPVMHIEILGKSESDTIFSGVVELANAGMWEVAALVFFASILVPGSKLLGLAFLMTTVHRRSHWRPRERAAIYRVIEYIGRWSMIDMFMVSILVALVQLGALATIEAGLGAVCFASVVVITMFAAMSFDPRLIWDALEEGR